MADQVKTTPNTRIHATCMTREGSPAIVLRPTFIRLSRPHTSRLLVVRRPLFVALIRCRRFGDRAKPLDQRFTNLLETRQLRLLVRENLVDLLQRLLMVSKLYLDVDKPLLIHA